MENKIGDVKTCRAMDRRSFLKLSGLLGMGMGAATLLPSAAEAVKFNRKRFKVSKTKLAMGTFVSMTLIHSSRDQAEEAMGLAFEEIERLTALMNRFDERTAVALLNKEGFLRDVPPEVAEVVSKALDYHRLTQGNFDISVKPVVDLFREKFAGHKGTPPSEGELASALDRIGSNKIELKGRELRFQKPGMGITLDGIAKGYIVDKASGVLASRDIRDHLINAGGDIRTMGSRQDRKPWTVAIEDPKKKSNYPDIVHLTDGAIATSGNYEVYFDREKIFHHIIDPSTGRSPELSTSVTSIASSAMDADALSTSVFVMGPLSGIRFIDSTPGCECFIVSKTGKTFKSAGWRSST